MVRKICDVPSNGERLQYLDRYEGDNTRCLSTLTGPRHSRVRRGQHEACALPPNEGEASGIIVPI